LRKSLGQILGLLAALVAFAGMAAAQSVLAQTAPAPDPEATGSGTTTVSLTFAPTVANDTYNPSAAITFTTVVISDTGGATPTGSVTFTDQSSGTQLPGSPVQLDGTGTATLAVTSGLAVGGNNIQAAYSGDANYAANSSQVVVVTLEKSTTTLTVTPATTAPTAGTNFSVVVSIVAGTPPAGAESPTGAVTLNVDGKAAGTAALATSSGTTSASFTVSVATAGSHALQAVYAGDENYEASTASAVTVTVAKMASVTTLTAAPATLTIGIPEALTAVVNAAAGVSTSTAPTGTVSFYDGTTLLGTQPVSSYSATLSNLALDTTKSHLITAVYSGDANFAPSTSNPVSLVAALLPDTVTLTATPTTAGPGQSINFTATVTPNAAPAANYEQNPTGTVTFYNGTTAVGVATLAPAIGNASVATLTLATLPAGSDTITAVYAGDSYFAPGTSNSVTVTVQDFSIVPAPSTPTTGLTIVKGSSGTAAFTVSGLGGYNSQIQLVCTTPVAANLSCTPSAIQVTPTATVTFTVQTYTTGGPISTTASNKGAGGGFGSGLKSGTKSSPAAWRAAGGLALALVAFFAPIGRRSRGLRRSLTRGQGLVLLLAGLCGAGVGCGSTTSSSQAGSGSPLGATAITITATAYINNAVVSHSVYLNVNVIPPSQ
jgi:hypothetical protein